ncbi:hypothetical protein [Spirochaeta africana]|uniref:PEGA domain-containing protein n=1 Tax=Spirochaeta africana (strain ATCC 700263 / DSM 8902 / Z-7692) TaxID=889378 RepID=H9UKC2_SPIAZ|nr:hypothetical protein [Spirochaeta africana]AFG37965.1 hypothetical protein Spiaf_1913 [Spirochaeta africana DSM 8902]
MKTHNNTGLPGKFLISLLLLICSAMPLLGLNTFDGEVAGVYHLPDDVFPARELQMRVGKLLLIDGLPHSSPLAEGIEITIEPPAVNHGGGSAFALYIFQEVESRRGFPAPDEIETGQIGSFQGQRIIFELLPSRSSFSIRIPARSGHGIRGGIDSRVTPVVRPEDGPLALAILPVMKGLPSEILNAPFTLTTRSLLTNVGGLEISAVSHDGRELDNQDIEELGLTIELDRYGTIQLNQETYIRPGIYQILLNSNGVLFDSTQVGVEQGRITRPVITLPRPESRVDFLVPGFISVTLDGEILNERSITLSPGEYEVLFEFESYSKRHTLSVQAGREYAVGVGLDINIDSREADALSDQ